MNERSWLIVPFCEVPYHTRAILNAVVPLCGPANRRIHVVAEHDVYRNAITPRVVDRHGSVLQSHRTMRQHGQRFTFHLEVPVRHGHGRLFVAISDELGVLIPTVVNDGFLHPAKTGSWIGADVLKAKGFDDIEDRKSTRLNS